MSVPPKSSGGDDREDPASAEGNVHAPALSDSGRSNPASRPGVSAAAFLPTLDGGAALPPRKGQASPSSSGSGSSTDDLTRGTTIGRYLITERLGAGGMGVVYAAYDPELDRKVAIKLLHTESWISDSTIGRVRLLREAQAMARLSHPNVIAVYDVGTFHDQVFVAMELIDGPTLSTWLRAAPRTRSEILGLFLQAGRGLRAAHAAGLVHRDFKPDERRFMFPVEV
jgi:serine/threonine protein kinase